MMWQYDGEDNQGGVPIGPCEIVFDIENGECYKDNIDITNDVSFGGIKFTDIYENIRGISIH